MVSNFEKSIEFFSVTKKDCGGNILWAKQPVILLLAFCDLKCLGCAFIGEGSAEPGGQWRWGRGRGAWLLSEDQVD